MSSRTKISTAFVHTARLRGQRTRIFRATSIAQRRRYASAFKLPDATAGELEGVAHLLKSVQVAAQRMECDDGAVRGDES